MNLSAIQQAWPKAVGAQIAAIATPRLLDSDRLIVVAHRSWVDDLRALETSLVSSVNRTIGFNTVSTLRVVSRD